METRAKDILTRLAQQATSWDQMSRTKTYRKTHKDLKEITRNLIESLDQTVISVHTQTNALAVRKHLVAPYRVYLGIRALDRMIHGIERETGFFPNREKLIDDLCTWSGKSRASIKLMLRKLRKLGWAANKGKGLTYTGELRVYQMLSQDLDEDQVLSFNRKHWLKLKDLVDWSSIARTRALLGNLLRIDGSAFEYGREKLSKMLGHTRQTDIRHGKTTQDTVLVQHRIINLNVSTTLNEDQLQNLCKSVTYRNWWSRTDDFTLHAPITFEYKDPNQLKIIKQVPNLYVSLIGDTSKRDRKIQRDLGSWNQRRSPRITPVRKLVELQYSVIETARSNQTMELLEETKGLLMDSGLGTLNGINLHTLKRGYRERNMPSLATEWGSELGSGGIR